jgi:D-alanyl-lipoteichoic acid acyltransferase DltB (MBOAT superfamily)
VVWGGLHGLYLATSVYYKPYQKKLHRRFGLEKSRWLRLWQTVVTFHLVCLAWIFFRAPTLHDAWYVLTHLAGGGSSVSALLLAHGTTELAIVSCSLAVVWTVFWVGEKTPVGKNVFATPFWCRWGAYGALGALLLLFNADSNAGFIYFQF